MTTLDRRVLFTSAAAAALLAATGVSSQAAPGFGGRLRAALSGARRQDHWGISNSAFMQAARGAVFETLTEIAGDGSLRAELAQAWETADAGLNWVFQLRQDVVFHDGIPLQEADIIALFKRFPALNAQKAALDQKGKLSVTLARANQNFPYLLANPEYALLPAEPERQAAGYGTGLYRAERFQPGRQFIGTRVQDHWKDQTAGWFEKVECVSIPSESVRAEALRSGLVDVADIRTLDPYMDPSDYQLLPGPEKIQYVCRRTLCVPDAIGQTWALDNTRMALRWWKA